MADPAIRKAHGEAISRALSKPESRARLSEAATKRFSDPDERERARERATKQFSDPTKRQKMSELISALHQTSEYQAIFRRAMRKRSLRYRGPLHHSWNPLKSDQERKIGRNVSGYRMWKRQVFERDGHRCLCCGSAEKLIAHHVLNFAQYPELRTDVENGVSLCRSCHASFHSTYGVKDNNARQLLEFFAVNGKEVNTTVVLDSFISSVGCDEARPSAAC